MKMNDLADRNCEPCAGGTALLDADAVARCLSGIEGWRVEDGKRLRKRYDFADFTTALAFVNRIGEVAESEGHHPDLELGWGRVAIEMWTHDAGGLTENDFIMAAKIDRAL
jgi:4a-hydroxytetrahydrobiopterin dehydratase